MARKRRSMSRLHALAHAAADGAQPSDLIVEDLFGRRNGLKQLVLSVLRVLGRRAMLAIGISIAPRLD